MGNNKKNNYQEWRAKVPDNCARVESEIKNLMAHIENMSAKVRDIVQIGEFSGTELKILKVMVDIGRFLGLANINHEKLEAIHEIMRILKRNIESFRWKKIQKELAERSEKFQKEDLERIVDEISELRKAQLRLLDEYSKALDKIAGGLKKELEILRGWLEENEAWRKELEEVIRGLKQRIDEIDKKAQIDISDYSVKTVDIFKKYNVQTISVQDVEKSVWLHIHEKDEESEQGTVIDESNIDKHVEDVVGKIERDMHALLEKDKSYLELTEKQKALLIQEKGELKIKLFASIKDRLLRPKLMEELRKKEADLEKCNSELKKLENQIKQREELLHEIGTHPVTKDKIEELKELISKQEKTEKKEVLQELVAIQEKKEPALK